MNRDQYINSPLPIEQELRAAFKTDSELVIFDIGSCEGEDSIRYSRLFPHSKIFSVEPLLDNVKLIRSNIEKYAVHNIHPLNLALSDVKGKAKFYVSSGQPEDRDSDADWDYGNKSSSLLPPDRHIEIAPWLGFKQSVEVETDTLHSVCQSLDIHHIDFIHMDVQGAELKVLMGAEEVLKTIRLVWLEVEAISLYQDQPLKTEIEAFFQQNHFFKLKDTVDTVCGDQLWINLRYVFENPGRAGLTFQSYINSHKKIYRQLKRRIKSFLPT